MCAPSTPASRIGRYCSLNVYSLAAHGTLEFRRFHATLDPLLLTKWAHFCVAFVEHFASLEWEALECATSVDIALRELQAAQEAATAADLMARMDGVVDPATAEYFLKESM